MAEEFVELNYDSGCTSKVERVDPEEFGWVLIGNRSAILFVGEGNFTFTLAFAAYRENSNPQEGQGVWEDIVSTHFEEQARPILSKLKSDCITNITNYGRKTKLDDKYPRRAIEAINDLPEIHFDIDARDIPQRLIPKYHGVIWFQCPWNGQETTGKLVEDFLVSTSKQLICGYVCVGITKQFPYITSYKLENILGASLKALDNSTEVLKCYKFLGVDDEYIKDILRFGYRHQGKRDIHDQIIDDHVTLVFQKKT